jgi:pimeloyl-ACP methyl ester carboxylesterase
MNVLARALHRAGFATENWSYQSVCRPIEQPGKKLAERLLELHGRPDIEDIHLVAHSMGSVLVRYALATGQFPKVRRVVMLAPPNQGSPIARLVAPVLGKVLPAVRQLSDKPHSWVRSLSILPDDIQLGIIAAQYDLLVPVEATRLPRPSAFLVVPSTHILLLFRKDVAEQVIHFLRTGQFTTAEPPPQSPPQ